MLEKTLQLCNENNVKLLYLCKFGSHLYGLETPKSDIDLKGIFLPDKNDLLLGRNNITLHYSSANDNNKNSNDDIDIDLFSLHYFLKLVSKGETNALDLLFSVSNEKSILYYDENLKEIFNNPLKIINPVNTNAYIGYAIGQAKKYGISSSRLGVIKDIFNFLQTKEINKDKLFTIADDILLNYYNDSYCFNKTVNNENALIICGKVHLYNITLEEFYNRIEREFNKYGERVRQAHNNENIDYKALSHAIRSLKQIKQLLLNGYIKFPFEGKDRQLLLNVKNGKMPYLEIEKIIIDGLKEIEELKKNCVENKTDLEFIDQQILKFYL